jgi:threonyl-tRNA synthetase
MGDEKTWNRAEKELEAILKENNFDYFIGEGEGAFYGPKLDILMEDCLGRQWQTGTIQLDFQLPRKFDLKYTDSNGQEKTPVVIHRVIYGSLERFMGILIEQFAGSFPVWLSPIQAKIIPITDKQQDYAQEIEKELKNNNIRVEIDDKAETMQNKIRSATAEKIPYMIIVGGREVENNTISVRQRDGQDLGTTSIEDFIKKINQQISEKQLNLIK